MQRLPIHRAVFCLTLVGVLEIGCRNEGKTPTLYTGVKDPDASKQASASKKQAPKVDPALEAYYSSRDLWFKDPDGKQAILAREQHDYQTAVKLLDRLLAKTNLSADDRGAAQWLRGLEDIRVGKFAEAAQRFAAARKAPSLKPLHDRLIVLEAQAHLDAGQPKRALQLINDLPDKGPLAESILMIKADAHLRTHDTATAKNNYEQFLAEHANSSRVYEARIKLARLLEQSGQPKDMEHAARLYKQLLLDVPLSDFAKEAAKKLSVLEKQQAKYPSLTLRTKTENFAQTLATLHAQLDRGRYSQLIHEADGILRKSLPAAIRCEVLYLKASAIFKQRKRAEARPYFDQAIKTCKRTGKSQQDVLVKSYYQAGRGYYAAGKYSQAAKTFEYLADNFKHHSYADDALILAGESWAELGNKTHERQAYQRSFDNFPKGDMAGEALRRLVVLALAEKRFDDGLKLTENIDDLYLSIELKAKLVYFRGRSFFALDRQEEAINSWLQAIDMAPTSYAALQALSRLRELGDSDFEKGLARLPSASESERIKKIELPEDPAVKRAVLLAKLGLGDEAHEELKTARIDGWPAAAILTQAGLWAESQRLLGKLGVDERQPDFPIHTHRKYWELAYPLAFGELVRSGEVTHKVPPLLTFAIMQTESRFDPSVTSWAGARGLIQLMPGTAKLVAEKANIAHFDANRLFNPVFNLDLGIRHVAELVTHFGGQESAVALVIPSYNAGIGAVQRWLRERGDWDFDLFIESIPYNETRKYTQSVLERWMVYRWVYGENEQSPSENIPYVPLQIPTSG